MPTLLPSQVNEILARIDASDAILGGLIAVAERPLRLEIVAENLRFMRAAVYGAAAGGAAA